MSRLPPGWVQANMGDIAQLSLGKMLDRKQATGLHRTPYLRNINVRWGTFDLTDLAEMDIAPEQLERVSAEPGDIVVCEGGEPGRAAVWRGPEPIALQKALHRIRPSGLINPYYVAFFLQHMARTQSLEYFFTGTTIKHLPKEKLKFIPVPLAPRQEQDRIVAAIEEQLSRLENGANALARVTALLERMRRAVMERPFARMAAPQMKSLDSLCRIVTGSTPPTSNPANYGSDIPFVTPANFDHGAHVTSSDRALSSEGAKLARPLPPGSVLATCIGATLGKTGLATVACTTNQQINALIPGDGIYSEYLFYCIARPKFVRMMWEESSSTTMPILNKSKLSHLQIPLVPHTEQIAIVQEISKTLEHVDRLMYSITRVRGRSRTLHSSILTAAFTGRLVPQDSTEEPASYLLEKIKVVGIPSKRRTARHAAAAS